VKKHSIQPVILSLSLVIILLLVGVSGYMIIEKYSFTDAFFMTINTIATVGYSTGRNLSGAGMYFTSFLIIFSFGTFAYAVSTFTRYVIEGVFRNYYRDNKVKSKIEKLEKHVVICGYGRNGKQSAAELREYKIPHVVLEKDDQLVEQLRADGETLYIHGDATRDEVLKAANLEKASALITTLPIDADNLFVVLTARQMNPKLKIISRASYDQSDMKLRMAGANNVIMPDKIGGQRMAKMIIHPDVVEFLDYLMVQASESGAIEEVPCDNVTKEFLGKPIRMLMQKNDSGANIVGIRRADRSFIVNPLPETIIHKEDVLFILGTKRQIHRLHKSIEGI
jgi:voltage-gated potassium channel